ncbi:hypothetical protein J2Y48_003150 [Mycoplana sp. BE70]|uniref:CDP-glycerol glycerophosphotransferase family protein n=1 Tax=Mycoplana sp. BE70 TaxID=2817775 RepID=UPI00285BBFDC|nr:CDP-glycerol glycerophosphotransferase family protein [Mycoplana sp. BE70]MDR6757853.1 hypothetical protein [Mycoplana sp. BE70]
MKLKLGKYDLIFKKRPRPKPKPIKVIQPSLKILNPELFERDAGDVRVILYHGDATLGSEHIYRQWRAEFIKSGVPFIGLFRVRNIFEKVILEFPDDQIVLLVGNEETPTLMSRMPALRAVMHTGNPGNIIHLIQYGDLKHCFIGHGDSYKNASASKTFRVYDEIWVAGQGHIDRLQRFGSSWRFRIVGRPQAKDFMSSAAPETLTACYLPTWEGPNVRNEYCSLEFAEAISNVLRETFQSVHVKLHPCTGFRLNNLTDVQQKIVDTGANLIDVSAPIDAVMKNSSICVTDVSSVVSDWLTSQRPVFVYVPKGVDRSSLPINTYCYIYSDIGELEALLNRVVVEGDDWLAAERAVASEYLVSSEATKTDQFVRQLRDVANM